MVYLSLRFLPEMTVCLAQMAQMAQQEQPRMIQFLRLWTDPPYQP
jgi:hypothetical protein